MSVGINFILRTSETMSNIHIGRERLGCLGYLYQQAPGYISADHERIQAGSFMKNGKVEDGHYQNFKT